MKRYYTFWRSLAVMTLAVVYSPLDIHPQVRWTAQFVFLISIPAAVNEHDFAREAI